MAISGRSSRAIIWGYDSPNNAESKNVEAKNVENKNVENKNAER